MKYQTINEVVLKLVGDIDPIGESSHDEKTIKNMETFIDVVDSLMGEIRRRMSYRYSPMGSVKEVGDMANEYFNALSESLIMDLED